jgi:hypothetical protein
MKWYLKIGLASLLFYSCSNRNGTETREFWYSEIDMPGKTGLTHSMINTYQLNDYFYIHARTNLPIDDNEYYYGISELRNDTFFFDFHEKREFDIRQMFSTEVEVSPKLIPCDLYFSSEVIPKTVCWKKTPIDSLSGIKEYSIHKFLE